MYYYRVSTALIFMTIFVFWEMIFCILTWQTISSWIVVPATQVIATVPRPILYNHHDNLPPMRRDQPQLQQHAHYLQDTDDDGSEDDYLVVNKSSNEDPRGARESAAAPTWVPHRLTKRKHKAGGNSNRTSQQQQTTQGRRIQQEDSNSTASDGDIDSIFDAIVPQQADVGNTSCTVRVRSRKQ
jgi:hypothetical protein